MVTLPDGSTQILSILRFNARSRFFGRCALACETPVVNEDQALKIIHYHFTTDLLMPFSAFSSRPCILRLLVIITRNVRLHRP